MNTERNLLLALVAVHSNLLSLEDVRQLWPEWRPDAEREFADLLVEHGRLSPEDKIHLHYLVESLLAKHDGNVTAGLAALYPAGEWQSFLETKPPDSLPSVTSMTLPPPPDTASPAPLPFANTLMTAPPTAEKAEAGPAAAGRFTRLRMHASGGMGRVWLARDQRLERDVALKELRPEFAGSPDVGRRFLVEARVTGRLEHPGIVPIYELVDEDGNSAYVMRFLRGRTLSEAIRAYHESKTGPTALERAALLQDFVALCNTVAYAHSRGVLHRDLKGQNILLGDFGEVIVLDWGLAKEMGQPEEAVKPLERVQSASASGEHTLPGQIMGTPQYMSPEQAAGETAGIDQRSDVYSLGAILYEILTGQPPFADQTRLAGEKTVQALLRRIREEPPTPPSVLASGVPVPLQAICLQALAKNPADRYQNATELAREVQRWLADEPVLAHPDSWTTRLGRWARRHRTMVTSLGVLAAAVFVGLTITTIMVNQEEARTEQARDRAVRNFHKAQEAVDRYFTQVSEDKLLKEPGMLPLRHDLLASAREFYEDFAKQENQDSANRQALGEAQLKLARITRAMGERDQAMTILEEAQYLFEQLNRQHPDVESHELGLAQCYLDHGYQSYLIKGRSP
jgi:serine/threonine protein kinase